MSHVFAIICRYRAQGLEKRELDDSLASLQQVPPLSTPLPPLCRLFTRHLCCGHEFMTDRKPRHVKGGYEEMQEMQGGCEEMQGASRQRHGSKRCSKHQAFCHLTRHASKRDTKPGCQRLHFPLAPPSTTCLYHLNSHPRQLGAPRPT
jgi:hypothetical protein